ncbi:MAG: hypothetical protein ACLQNE_34060 [Thermoguttaceae bacterium]
MIGRIFRWNRLVLPPWWGFASFLLIYLFNEELCLYVGWWLDPPGDVTEFVRMRWLILGIGAVIFAVFRVTFHPAHRPEYRAWLARTPWTVSKPLPLGPVHLIPQDIIILGLLLLLMRTTGKELILEAFAFLFAYQLAAVVTLRITGERWAAYGLLFCLSIAIRLLQAGSLGIAVLAIIYPLTYWAHLRCIARLPWHSYPVDILRVLFGSQQRQSAENHPLGFPFQFLAPKLSVPAIGLAEGTALSLLAGVWAYALIANGPDADSQVGISVFVCLIPVLVATATRLVLYCGNYWPPISLLGRLATSRFIIVRYDQVLVAPLMALLVLAAGCLLFLRTGQGATWGMPLVLAIGLWFNLNLGPRLLVWRLTGGHRIGLGLSNRQLFAEP